MLRGVRRKYLLALVMAGGFLRFIVVLVLTALVFPSELVRASDSGLTTGVRSG
jgi:branched-subunit amino acid transport protein